MQKAVITVQGMSCKSCVRSIEGALENIGAAGQVQFEQGTVEVQYDENTLKLSDVEEVIRNKGYQVL